MEDAEKLNRVRVLGHLKEEDVEDELIQAYLDTARQLILDRRNPFSDDSSKEQWEPRYDSLQCEIAVDMIARRGAEGEVTHTENGISRQWVTGYVTSRLLSRVIPKAKAI